MYRKKCGGPEAGPRRARRRARECTAKNGSGAAVTSKVGRRRARGGPAMYRKKCGGPYHPVWLIKIIKATWWGWAGRGVGACNPFMPVHVSCGSAVVALAPFLVPFWSHFGSQVRHYTLFWVALVAKRPTKKHVDFQVRF